MDQNRIESNRVEHACMHTHHLPCKHDYVHVGVQDGEKGWQHQQSSLQRFVHELARLASLHRRTGSHYQSQGNPRGDKLICFTQSKWPGFSYTHWQMQPPTINSSSAGWVFEKEKKKQDLDAFIFTSGSLGKRWHWVWTVLFNMLSIYLVPCCYVHGWMNISEYAMYVEHCALCTLL